MRYRAQFERVVNDTRLILGGGTDETVALLEWARLAGGLSPTGVSKAMGVSTTTVQEYRQGRRPQAGWLFVVRWLKACGFRLVIERG